MKMAVVLSYLFSIYQASTKFPGTKLTYNIISILILYELSQSTGLVPCRQCLGLPLSGLGKGVAL